MTWTVMELAGKRFSQIIQWCRGGLRVAEKVSKVSKRNQYPLITQTNDYGILRRSFNVDCTDCNVHVWLSYIDCGCLESATRMG